jgi:hypothetical protein
MSSSSSSNDYFSSNDGFTSISCDEEILDDMD